MSNRFKCIGRYEQGGKGYSYKIHDNETGEEKIYTGEAIKRVIVNGVTVDNLRLTKDNRLIYDSDEKCINTSKSDTSGCISLASILNIASNEFMVEKLLGNIAIDTRSLKIIDNRNGIYDSIAKLYKFKRTLKVGGHVIILMASGNEVCVVADTIGVMGSTLTNRENNTLLRNSLALLNVKRLGIYNICMNSGDLSDLFSGLDTVSAISFCNIDFNNTCKADRMFADCLKLRAVNTTNCIGIAGSKHEMFKNTKSLVYLDKEWIGLDDCNITTNSKDIFYGSKYRI
jgi:hypothetical protein